MYVNVHVPCLQKWNLIVDSVGLAKEDSESVTLIIQHSKEHGMNKEIVTALGAPRNKTDRV